MNPGTCSKNKNRNFYDKPKPNRSSRQISGWVETYSRCIRNEGQLRDAPSPSSQQAVHGGGVIFMDGALECTVLSRLETETPVRDDERTVSMVEQHVRDSSIHHYEKIHGQQKTTHTVFQPGKGMIRKSSEVLDPRSFSRPSPDFESSGYINYKPGSTQLRVSWPKQHRRQGSALHSASQVQQAALATPPKKKFDLWKFFCPPRDALTASASKRRMRGAGLAGWCKIDWLRRAVQQRETVAVTKAARSSKTGVMEMTGDEMEAGRGESYEVFSFFLVLVPRSRSGSDWGRLEPWAKPGESGVWGIGELELQFQKPLVLQSSAPQRPLDLNHCVIDGTPEKVPVRKYRSNGPATAGGTLSWSGSFNSDRSEPTGVLCSPLLPCLLACVLEKKKGGKYHLANTFFLYFMILTVTGSGEWISPEMKLPPLLCGNRD
ncbi:hypothetical protein CEK26_013209 [Fusarium fujikuroi]|uniref:Uncharacterized protein n=1 Tax=Fusarium fujikuroi TaxID=5127 RepID=A0A5Q3F5K4_FUSFU|nr:hypothetical protein CEK27_013223 [Fusarium fujikuroi]QGI86616.1 hypothetical protein CEK25_013345 [Fusarium fujikuroi]QGJ00141.1 hypothetical protein CEK26_013209 [Fusarium fujikuroi]VTT58861.1 unnamed protein product [Fusarium fujikuroi]VTT77577.1 unnamed protein product [Fusarium fujikuroi]